MKHLYTYIVFILCTDTVMAYTYNYMETPFFYTSYGEKINEDSCPFSICQLCDIGYYNLNCGMDEAQLLGNNCTKCPDPPTNAHHMGFYTAKQGVLTSPPQYCPFLCDTNYVRSDITCVLSQCNYPSVLNAEPRPGATYPTCDYQCTSGYYGAALNPTVCQMCPYGTWSASGATVCTACAAGKFSVNSAATSSYFCQDCAQGTWSAVTTGTSACTSCIRGQYLQRSGESSNTCVTCSAGTYSSQEGSAVCTGCIQGKYSVSSGATTSSVCVSCGVGTYSGSVGVSACTPCPLGAASNIIGATSISICAGCPAGTYATTGASMCTPCPIGTFQAFTGASSCPACTPGYNYSSIIGARTCTSCTYCPTGQYRAGCNGTMPGTCTGCTNRP